MTPIACAAILALAAVGDAGDWNSKPRAATGNINGLREGLRELGYVEGRNIRFEYRWEALTKPGVLNNGAEK